MTSVLADLDLKTEYRSDSSDLVRDFYLPCLERSTLYRRAVGYFTSRGLSVAAQGISALINGDGHMLLVASPLFDSDDLQAIHQGYMAREEMVTKTLLRQIESTPDVVARDRLGFLAWLISEERLEIRIAVPVDEAGSPRHGIYHEKLGLFSDREGNSVAFTGSPNETAGGLLENFETIDVFWSWEDSQERVHKKISNFDRLCRNETKGLSVIGFPEAVRTQLLHYRPKDRPTQESPHCVSNVTESPSFPQHLWGHQIEAIEAWESNQRTGLISMATGSGKTLTALIAAQRCPNLQILVIAVPKTALVDQWAEEVEKHTSFSDPIRAYASAANWQESLFNRLRAARRRSNGPMVVIGTLHK